MTNLIKELLDNISKYCSKQLLTILIVIFGTISCFLSFHIVESYSEEIKKINSKLETKLASTDAQQLIKLQEEANERLIKLQEESNERLIKLQKEANQKMLDEQEESNQKMLDEQKEFYNQKINKLEEDFKDLKSSNDYIVKQFLSRNLNL